MRQWAAAVAVLLALAACSPGSGDAAAARTSAPSTSAPKTSAASLPTVREPAPPVPGMEAEAVQLRTDAAAGGRLQVRVTASDTFTVTSVGLDSPGFARLPPTRTTADFRPGRTIDLRTPFGTAQCDVSPEPASARLTVVRSGSRPEKVEVPLAAEVLEKIHTAECVEQAVEKEVEIRVVGLGDDGDGLAGSLVVRRRSGERTATLSDLRRSVLMQVEADLPLTLPAGAPEAEAALRFTPYTCEPHVRAETKQPFLFPMAVRLGDDDPVVVDLAIPDDVRAQLQGLVQRVCH